MPDILRSLTRYLKDPPPKVVFEIATDAVRMARSGEANSIESAALEPGVISPSPLHDNIALPEPLQAAVYQLAPGTGRRRKQRTAAVLLPDNSAHVTVLEFSDLPDNHDEQRALIRARLKRSVPFDIEAAALSYWIQDAAALTGTPAKNAKVRRDVIVATTPPEIIHRYEAPFRNAGFEPGLVTLSSLACLGLVDNRGISIVARLSGVVLTVLVKQDRILKLTRSIALAETASPLDEIAGHLFQTFVYVEDNLGRGAEQLYLAGFGSMELQALETFPDEFKVPVLVLGGADTGIRGYLKGAV
jgi:type IV pilus assembly protein PilM